MEDNKFVITDAELPDYSNNQRPSDQLKAKEIYQIINKVVDLPTEQIQDVFQAYSMIVEYCLKQGIDIKIPYIGSFKTRVKKGHRKGDTYKVVPKGSQSFTYITDENGEKKYVKQTATEDIYRTCEEDEPDYLIPIFKYVPSLRNRIKEETIKKWEE